nr:MAG: ORF1 [Torque teno midi virus]
MPFWWRRRRRPWYGRRYKRRNFTKRYKRRTYRRRKYRRPTRRRRRRRKKVRRKRKTLSVRQWQPDTIRKCKIKGMSTHVLGAHGKQFACFTDTRTDWTPPLQPGGGGFGVEKYSLSYLYEENIMGNNVWTQSNKYLDLCRYQGCKFEFFRHPHIDFVVKYNRMLPMKLEKFTYPDTHPQAILLARHKRIIPSLLTKPHGKRTVKIKIGPPKQTTNKWFFQETFAPTGLVQISAAAADLRYPHLGCCNTNELLTFACINLQFYQRAGWGNPTDPITVTSNKWYIPRNNQPLITKVTVAGKEKTISTSYTNYHDSISFEKGWFQPDLLQATKFEPAQEVMPITYGRYNPTRDTGEDNEVWFQSTLSGTLQPPKIDQDLYIHGLPIWQALFGFANFVQKVKNDKTFLESYVLCIRSKFIEPAHTISNIYIVIDNSFIQGKGPYDSYTTSKMKQTWFPKVLHQQRTINQLVVAGPFIPKLENQRNSTWELYSKYTFYFKFGGSELPEPDVFDPATQGQYPVPTNISQTVQVCDPERTTALATLHSWDFRRGIITSKAYKRMYENQPIDSDVQTDTDYPQAKKKKKMQGNALTCLPQETEEIQACLHSLCEEPTCQEPKTQEELLFLIHQQQQQQKQLKQNLLTLIKDLKNKQKIIQLQTGILE